MQKYQAAIIGKKSNQPDINWTDFNFPPLIKLFHFDISELWLYISYLLIFAATIFNLLDCIVQAGLEYPKIRILYAFLNLFIFNGVQMYIFYRGYKGICAEEGLLKIYKIMHVLAGLVWLTISIISALGWNGFVRANKFNMDGYGGLVFLSVVESMLYLVSFIIMPICVYKVHSFIPDSGVPSENI